MYDPWSVLQRGVVELNFSGCQSWFDVVKAVKSAFDIPDFYGTNINALWDCLEDFSLSWDKPIEIQIRGYAKLPCEAAGKADEIMTLFNDMHTEYPHIHYTVLN